MILGILRRIKEVDRLRFSTFLHLVILNVLITYCMCVYVFVCITYFIIMLHDECYSILPCVVFIEFPVQVLSVVNLKRGLKTESPPLAYSN